MDDHRAHYSREGEPMAKMTEPEIQDRMAGAKGWERRGDMLVRSWQFPSARRALAFVNEVAALAEQRDHYPDLILSHRVVRLELSTHDEGGLTDRDFAFAAQVDALRPEAAPGAEAALGRPAVEG